MLPKNERRTIETNMKHVYWIYGQPYSGKTYLANSYPDVIMLNTDGNTKFIDAPYVAICDEYNGHIRTSAWNVFKRTVNELAADNGGFKTVVVDLLEDVYNYARSDVLAKQGWTHESDGTYGKGYTLVQDEFLTVIKKLVSLNFDNIIFISHTAQGKVTKMDGMEITTFAPNIRDKIALKISGMVDFTGQLSVTDNGERIIQIKPNNTVFGGGRAGFVGQTIKASKSSIDALYNGTDTETVPESIPAAESVKTQPEVKTGENKPVLNKLKPRLKA